MPEKVFLSIEVATSVKEWVAQFSGRARMNTGSRGGKIGEADCPNVPVPFDVVYRFYARNTAVVTWATIYSSLAAAELRQDADAVPPTLCHQLQHVDNRPHTALGSPRSLRI